MPIERGDGMPAPHRAREAVDELARGEAPAQWDDGDRGREGRPLHRESAADAQLVTKDPREGQAEARLVFEQLHEVRSCEREQFRVPQRAYASRPRSAGKKGELPHRRPLSEDPNDSFLG